MGATLLFTLFFNINKIFKNDAFKGGNLPSTLHFIFENEGVGVVFFTGVVGMG